MVAPSAFFQGTLGGTLGLPLVAGYAHDFLTCRIVYPAFCEISSTVCPKASKLIKFKTERRHWLEF